MDQILRKIQVNSEALKCKNVDCENGDHKNYIELLCRQLVEDCLQAGDKTLPKLKQAVPQKSIPMWNRVAKEKWFTIWLLDIKQNLQRLSIKTPLININCL